MAPPAPELPTRSHPAPAFRAALEGVRPSMAEIATALGLPGATLSSYYTGIRGVPPRVQSLTAAYLRAQAAHLETLARALEATAALEPEP